LAVTDNLFEFCMKIGMVFPENLYVSLEFFVNSISDS